MTELPGDHIPIGGEGNYPDIGAAVVQRFRFTPTDLPLQLGTPQAGEIIYPGSYISIQEPFDGQNPTLAIGPAGFNPATDAALLQIPASQADGAVGPGFSYPPSYISSPYTADGTNALELVIYDAFTGRPVHSTTGAGTLTLVTVPPPT